MILTINKELILEATLPKLSKKELKAEANTDDKFKVTERFSDAEIQNEIKNMKKALINTKGELMDSLNSIIEFVKGSNLKEINKRKMS